MLFIFRMNDLVTIPKIATEGSACFDLRADLSGESVKANTGLREYDLQIHWPETIAIPPQTTVMIPTGLVFDIPVGYSVRLHPRSGLAYKGLTLANCEGVLDSDYVQEVKVLLHNQSMSCMNLNDGDRICQAELVKNTPCEIGELTNAPERKTERNGGFGSTGK
jgi:dUTP pyrophosphatase